MNPRWCTIRRNNQMFQVSYEIVGRIEHGPDRPSEPMTVEIIDVFGPSGIDSITDLSDAERDDLTKAVLNLVQEE